MTDVIDDPSTWFAGFINAALIKLKLADPINAAFAAAAPNGRSMSRTSTVNVATGIGSFTAVPGTFTQDYASGDVTYSSGIFTIVTPGLYMLALATQWPAVTGTQHRIVASIYQNGATTDVSDTSWRPSSAAGTTFRSLTGILPCAANDTLQGYLGQDSGSTIAVTPSRFAIARVA